mmetsp:Transcript_65860/g.137173  ORF Transcript_65860/g.137173 Transcript_65860/m.137173 type:complete len:140 (+) Transcript_65860:319-738(+)
MPVRLAFQMYHEKDSITLLSYTDKTDQAPPSEKAGAYMRRAEAKEACARDTKDLDEAALCLEKAEKFYDLACRVYSAIQDSEATNNAMTKYNAARKAKEAAVKLAAQSPLHRLRNRDKDVENAGDPDPTNSNPEGGPTQ